MGVLQKGKIVERECRNVLKSRKEMWTGFGVMYSSSFRNILAMASRVILLEGAWGLGTRLSHFLILTHALTHALDV
jgi:hypothetical protein